MIVLLSGRTASGKTTVAPLIAERLLAPVLSARAVLFEMIGVTSSRAELQRAGVELDQRTAGRWLLEYLLEHHANGPVVVDAMRTRRQTEAVLAHAPDSYLIYLTAHEATRRRRYALAALSDAVKRETPFEAAENHPTERGVVELRQLAHLIVETDDLTPGLVADECEAFFDKLRGPALGA